MTIFTVHLQVAWAMFLPDRAGGHTMNESLLKMMKKGSRWREVTYLHQCLSEFANPRIREDEASQEFRSDSDKMHRATPDTGFTQAWFDHSRSSFPQSVRNTGTDVEFLYVPTYQCSTLFNNMGSFRQKSEFRRPEKLDKPITKGETDFVPSQRILAKELRACDSETRGRQLVVKRKAIAWGLWLGGMPLKQTQWCNHRFASANSWCGLS